MSYSNSKAKELAEKVNEAREKTIEAVKTTADTTIYWSAAAAVAAEMGELSKAAVLSSFANQAAQATTDLAKLASDDQFLNTFTKMLDAAMDEPPP